MLPIAFNPYMDDVLRKHLLRFADQEGLNVTDLEDLLVTESDAVAFLREAGADVYRAYVEDLMRSTGGVDFRVEPVSPKAHRH